MPEPRSFPLCTMRSPCAARRSLLLPGVALWLAVVAGAASAGTPYEVLEPARDTAAAPGQVEVVEFFWYGCPHCYFLEPYLERWLEQKPDWVIFSRVPAPLGPRWQIHARAFYVAQRLGVLERIHGPLFQALHRDRRRLNDFESLRAFFEEQGVRKEDFTIHFYSEEVETLLGEALAGVQQYRLGGVPAVAVAGKYLVTPSSVGRLHQDVYPYIMEVVQQLAEQEFRRSRPSPASAARAQPPEPSAEQPGAK